MPFVARNPRSYVKTSVGTGQCVAFVQAAAMTGHTSGWRRGTKVKGTVLLEGTAIATFDESGCYINDTSGKSHAAIYLRQSSDGIFVLDQWITVTAQPDGTKLRSPHSVAERMIPFRVSKKYNANGDNYFVIIDIGE